MNTLTPAEHEQLVLATADLLTSTLRGSYKVFDNAPDQTAEQGDSRRHNYLTTGLRSYHAPTLRKIIAMRADSLSYWYCYIIDIIIQGDVPLNEAFVSDYLHLSRCLTRPDPRKHIGEAILAFSSLRHYENITPNNLAHEYPETRTAQDTAILTAVTRMEESAVDGLLAATPFEDANPALASLVKDLSDGTIRYISDERLRSLLTDDSDPAAVTKVITERDLFNYDDITAIMKAQRDNATVALHEGIL